MKSNNKEERRCEESVQPAVMVKQQTEWNKMELMVLHDRAG